MMLRTHRKARFLIWRILLVALPAILLSSWLLRPGKLPEPIQLSAPEPRK